MKPIFVDHALDFGLKIRYFPKENLGTDRAVAAFAAREKIRLAGDRCEFGTATTIDVVDANGDFIGGIIAPGISTLADSLFFKKPRSSPQSRDRKTRKSDRRFARRCYQRGNLFRLRGLVGKILEKFIEELGEKRR